MPRTGPTSVQAAFWERMYRALVRFRARHGHCRVPAASSAQLHTWVGVQRRAWRAGTMPAVRTLRLLALGFPFEVPAGPADDGAWEARLAELAAFRARHGHTLVPIRARVTRGLSNWVRHQRVLGRRGRLAPERRARLEALGFAWRARDAAWDEKLEALRAFARRHGHLDVPAATPRLGPWVNLQRGLARQGRLGPERKRALEALGFRWAVRERPRSDELLQGACDWRRREGHWALVPDTPLQQWASRQRMAARQGQLPAQVQRQLDSLGFPWTREEVLWERRYAQVLAHWRREGRRVRLAPATAVGRWWASQCEGLEAGTLEAHQEERVVRLLARGQAGRSPAKTTSPAAVLTTKSRRRGQPRPERKRA